MIKLKKLLKESFTWKNRKFGERLPTMEDYKKAHDKKNIKEGIQRWEVYISGESKPLILTGKNEKEVKQLAHMMIRNSGVRISKVKKI